MSAARPSSIQPSSAPPPPGGEGVTVKVAVVGGEVPTAFEQVNVNT